MHFYAIIMQIIIKKDRGAFGSDDPDAHAVLSSAAVRGYSPAPSYFSKVDEAGSKRPVSRYNFPSSPK